jgi:hypothetical protein
LLYVNFRTLSVNQFYLLIEKCLNHALFNLNCRTLNGNPISNFMGIPFAKPPVGELRFKRPEPIEPWTETLQANKHVDCIQVKT